eukprot:10976604-Lingulodinium_polyedra.AAC.1
MWRDPPPSRAFRGPPWRCWRSSARHRHATGRAWQAPERSSARIRYPAGRSQPALERLRRR